MSGSAVRHAVTVLAHAAVGWALCFAAVSFVYFTRFGYTAPLRTAVAFTRFVVVVDFAVVALLILRSVDMFASPLGTWIPFAFIFGATWLTGLLVTGRRRHVPSPPERSALRG